MTGRASDAWASYEAFERWAYGEGWSAGMVDGRRRGFEEGYGAGFDAGTDVGAARLLLALERALGGRLPDLVPSLPHAGEYLDFRRRTARSDEPCGYACGACSQCVRAAATAQNIVLHGSVDYPGIGTVQSGRCG